MNREEFLKERMTGIGGSDSASICRQSKWSNPIKVYQDKMGESTPIKDNIRMKIGRFLEDGMLKLYEDETGIKLSDNPGLIRHPKYDFLLAHVDGIVNDSHIVEIKVISTPNHSEWSEPVEQGYDPKESIPIIYYFQIMHYLMVTGLGEAHLCAYLGGFLPLRIYKFKIDPGFVARMRSAEISFWRENVLKKQPPKPITKDELACLITAPQTDEMIEATEEDEAAVENLNTLNQEMKEIKNKQKVAADKVACRIGGDVGLKRMDDQGNWRKLATYKCNKRGSRTLRSFG